MLHLNPPTIFGTSINITHFAQRPSTNHQYRWRATVGAIFVHGKPPGLTDWGDHGDPG